MNRGGALTAVAAVLADAASILVSFWLLPWLARFFAVPSLSGGLFFSLTYLAFCLAVYLLRRTGAVSVEAAVGTGTTVLAVVLGILVAFTTAVSVGFSVDALLELDLGGLAGSSAAIAALVAALLLVFLYMLALVVPVPPAAAATEWRPVVQRLVMLLAANLMLIASTAHWATYFADMMHRIGLSGGGIWPVFVVAYAFFGLFYGGLRLLLARSGAGVVPLITFLLQTGYYVWTALSQTAW